MGRLKGGTDAGHEEKLLLAIIAVRTMGFYLARSAYFAGRAAEC